jgi:LPS-assembly protein
VDEHLQALGGNDCDNRFRDASLSAKRHLRFVLLFISIIGFAVGHEYLHAQGVTNEEPPTAQTDLPDLSTIPRATPMAADKVPERAVLESDTQSKRGDVYLLAGDVQITYRDHILKADTVSYDGTSGQIVAQGHVQLSGGQNDEHIQASHGTYNLRTQTGRFYDVTGSVGLHENEPLRVVAQATNAGITPNSSIAAPVAHQPGYATQNPFLFDGKIVEKTGPQNYVIYGGSVTSCLLPHPDWQLFARVITMDGKQAKAKNSVFKILGIPLLFLPYVTHPVNQDERQSGLLIPTLGYSSASQNTGSKGFTIGEQVYIAAGRSADVTAGFIYYSLRGFGENGTVRYRGVGNDFFDAHFSALQDRGFEQPTFDAKGNPISIYTNQGGQDVTSSFRRELSTHVRAVGDAEYLSSYVYREAFTENFNQAVSTDITSTLYLTDQRNGLSFDGRVDRYEGLKVVPVLNQPGQEVKIFHAPSLDFTGLDHHIAGTPLLWSVTASAAGLKRVQPNFATPGITERLDLRPEISLPLAFAGWHALTSIAVRETAYSRSRKAPYGNGATPVELVAGVNRADVEVNIDIRPAVIERTFVVPERWRWLLGEQVRHTIEPDITYTSVHGVNNFLSLLRFDDVDLQSDTDELKYALTQHLYFKPRKKTAEHIVKPGCEVEAKSGAEVVDVLDPVPRASNDANGIPNISATAPDMPTRTHVRKKLNCDTEEPVKQQEWFSWELSQKHFFAENFGGAVINQRRNIFDTTLNFSGIAFLTEARSISPLKSRMRFRTSSHTDVAWDFDYDTGANKFTSSNTFFDVHEGKYFGGFSYALLNAPGRFHSEAINTVTNTATGLTTSAISDFSQMRVLLGYGTPSQPGLSVATSAGLDLNAGNKQDSSGVAQYITAQASYNWNCCGLTLEYRKYDLGTIRDEGAYRFNFTLANIGTAGNLRRAESLF